MTAGEVTCTIHESHELPLTSWLSKNSFWILISSDLKNFGFRFACSSTLQGDAIREFQSTSGNLIKEELYCLYLRLSITETSTSASMTRLKPLCGSQETGKFCLQRNLYSGQEAIVRIGHGLVQNWERSTSRLYTVTLLT